MLCSKHNFLTICFFFSFFFAGCNIDKTPLKTDTGIDPAIIGDWYYETTGTIAEGISVEEIRGIRILANGIIMPLAVEISTGKLAKLPEPSLGTFLFAQNDRFSFETNPPGSLPSKIYNSKYKVKSQELIIETMTEKGRIFMLDEEYLKSKVGNIIADPVQTHLEMMIRDYLFTSAEIGSIPTALAGLNLSENDTSFIIRSRSEDRHLLIIELEDFNGTGNYLLGNQTSGRATVTFWGELDAMVISTDSEAFAGTVDIHSFDLINNRCTGTFEFEIPLISFKNGVFSVPIYGTN